MALRDRFRRKPAPNENTIGRSGTNNTNGFLDDEELNWRLRWPHSLDVYDQMRRTDPTIRWMLSLVKTPLRAATWNVEPFSEADKDREIAGFVREALFKQLAGGWDEFLRQALLYLDFGHMVFESVADLREVSFTYQPAEVEGRLEPGSENSRQVTREAFVFDRLAPRMPRTINRWVTAPHDPSMLIGIEQQLSDGIEPAIVAIPSSRLLIFSHDKEADDWRGTSMLRTAYKSWKFKLELENLEGMAYERSAGLPIVYPPQNAKSHDLDSVEDAVKNIRQGEVLYIIMPGPKAGITEDKEGWFVDYLAIKGDAAASASEAINRYDMALARNVLGEFMRLGLSGAGARATADVQQDPYYQALESYARYIEDIVDENLIKPLVEWNYETDRYPHLSASKMQAKNIATVASVLQQMSQVRVVQPDDRLEDWLRTLIDAPPRQPGAEDRQPEGVYAPTPNGSNGSGSKTPQTKKAEPSGKRQQDSHDHRQ